MTPAHDEHPRIDLPAPTAWPMVVALGITLAFAGLVTHAAVTRATRAPTSAARYAIPSSVSATPNNNASSGCRRPAGSGRARVRFILASMSRSQY